MAEVAPDEKLPLKTDEYANVFIEVVKREPPPRPAREFVDCSCSKDNIATTGRCRRAV